MKALTADLLVSLPNHFKIRKFRKYSHILSSIIVNILTVIFEIHKYTHSRSEWRWDVAAKKILAQ